MADPTTPTTTARWHLWAVGILSLLWNAFGALDFCMTESKNPAYLKGFTPAQIEYIYAFPLWSVVAWGLAVWAGVLGSILLLARRRLAVPVFLVSLIAMVVTAVHNYLLSDWVKVMGGGVGMPIFSAVIFVICLALWLYAKSMRSQGVLR
jgi:hypothetical protein